MHPSHLARLDDISHALERGDHEEAYRLSVLYCLVSEYGTAFKLAFLRPFSVPRMAAVLAGGRMSDDPEARAQRTSVLMYEIIAGGVDGERSQRVIAHMNRAHASPAIFQEDLTYILCAFIVVPARFIESFAWRAPSPAEKEAAHAFYAALGGAMNIATIPTSFDDAVRMFDTYERQHVQLSDDGATLGRAIIELLRIRLPRPMRSLAEPIFTTQVNDSRVVSALGLRLAPAPFRRALQVIVRARSRHMTRSPLSSEPSFTPGGPGSKRTFPQGYRLRDLIS